MERENFSVNRDRKPRLPLPPHIMGSEVGSFAYNTVVKRLPEIARRTIAENNFPPSIVENLQNFIQEIPDGLVRIIDDRGADVAAWKVYVELYLGKNWLDVPWYFAEAYFYRRILAATNYFRSERERGIDPFEEQKRLGIETSKHSIQALSALVNQWIYAEPSGNIKWNRDNFITLLYLSLWGNRADLSLWPAGEFDRSRVEIERERTRVLVDDTEAIADRVSSFNGVRIDFIADNAGFELVSDLAAIDFLLATNVAATVYLHLKAHPTFVSDAMSKDVRHTLEILTTECDPEVRLLASRLQDYINEGRLRLREDLFWTSPLAFWEMPELLRGFLAEASLVFVKGDANYRRLLGDRHWPFTTPFQDIACYFPAPVVALRTLKAELAAGFQPSQVEILDLQDPNWLTDGQWGVIQFAD